MAGQGVELTLFACGECYVYQVPPASSAAGHHANDWNVDKWLREVSAKVISQGDTCRVSLFDKETGALFADCPLPDNPANFLAAVEPVLDSSRYFVLKIVDKASKRHAFVGLGFRERTQASDFNAALDEHRQYLRRKKEADESKAKFAAASGEAKKDYSLQPGEKIVIKGIKKSPSPGSKKPEKRPSLVGIASSSPGKLAPPPSSSPSKQAAPTKAEEAPPSWVADFEEPEKQTDGNTNAGFATVTGAVPESSDGFGDDQWGDFEG